MKFNIYTGGDKNDLYDLLFADLRQLHNVKLISSLPAIPREKQKLWDMTHKPSLNRKKPFFMRKMWNKYNDIETFSKEDDVCLVFNNVSIAYFEPSAIKKAKERGVHTVLYILDTWDSYYSWQARLAVEYGCFEVVYTFHKPDAKKYGFEYLNSYYSVQKVARKNDPEYDCFFWGSDKGRAEKIETLYKKLVALGLKCDFGICYVPSDHKKIAGITYDKTLTYPEMIGRMQNAKVLVDVTGDQSEGMSLRVYESVVYGKKLLTDNPLVTDMLYGKSENIQIFGTKEVIDKSFFERTCENYNYNNEFSPVNWINELENRYE